jgi:hypothetical protein
VITSTFVGSDVIVVEGVIESKDQADGETNAVVLTAADGEAICVKVAPEDVASRAVDDVFDMAAGMLACVD